MNINIYNQLFNLAIFIITGMIIGVLFDIFRIIRRSFKTPDFITYIEDILFWILTGFVLLFTIFTFNNGEIRIYIFVGIVFGAIIYLLTLSQYFIKINVAILNFIKKMLYYPFRFIIKVIKGFIFKPFLSPWLYLKEKVTKLAKKTIKKKKFPNIFNKINE